ncbi:hypothetical protein N5I32_13900 [Acidimangrovimonas sediminis]|uniref:Uncharacterized protein n=1 Tax=Albidovulum sediminis TaxID=3066345 RepID=A0ABT2NPG9_9RHOB|nr:hypothetical protein [Defluviimonas sediminis]
MNDLDSVMDDEEHLQAASNKAWMAEIKSSPTATFVGRSCIQARICRLIADGCE